MPFDPRFRQQVQLLVSVLPLVAEERRFALKGGTAINLFVRDLPRLSVDIDLTYLPVADRTESLKAIDSALRRIGDRITGAFPDMAVQGSVDGPLPMQNEACSLTGCDLIGNHRYRSMKVFSEQEV